MNTIPENIIPIWRSSGQQRAIAKRVEKIRAEGKVRAKADQRRKARAAKAHSNRIETERQAAWAARQLSFAFESPISKALATLGAARKRAQSQRQLDDALDTLATFRMRA